MGSFSGGGGGGGGGGGNAIEVDWTNYGSLSTIVGWSGTPTANIWYKQVGNIVFVQFNISGTSDSSAVNFTLPITSKNSTNARVRVACLAKDNGTILAGAGLINLNPGQSTVNVYTDFTAPTWTPSGTKQVMGQFWFEAA